MRTQLIAGCLGVVFMASPSLAQTPLGTAFTYQGRLSSAGGPANGVHDLRFTLFDAAVDGAAVGSTLCANDVSIADGYFTVVLDFGAQFAGEQRFLGIEVRADTGLDCDDATGFVALASRQALTAAPNALFALNATQLNGQAAGYYMDAANLSTGTLADARLQGMYSGLLSLTNVGNSFAGSFAGDGAGLMNLNAGTITQGLVAPAFGGTGRDTSGAALGSLMSADGGGGWSLLAPGADSQVLTLVGGVPMWENSSGFTLPYTGAINVPAPDAVFHLINTTTTNGTTLWLETSGTNGIGIYSNASATSGFAYGGQFYSASPDGRAVFGSNTATTGPALGGRFGSASTEGRAIYATASAATGDTCGILGEALSVNGAGVYGIAPASTSGTNYGVYGQSNSSSGRGVQGVSPNYGVYGGTTGAGGTGVYGFGPTGVQGVSLSGGGIGTQGVTFGAGLTYGVYGQAPSSGFAVWSAGKLGASGTKSFRIDYPNDPENKYLLHYSAESPEVLNIYRGMEVLDSVGEAVVRLPEYFAMINKTPSYTLTAVGAAMPMLHVAEEIDEAALSAGAKAGPGDVAPICTFRIAGGAPGAKVSWRVEAIRNDRWVQVNGAPVEVKKEGKELGRYQHPDLYGQPRERGIGADRERMKLEER